LQQKAEAAAPLYLCTSADSVQLEMVQRKPWTKQWKILYRRPTNLGALADVFGKPLGLFLPHQVVVLESPLELFSLFRLAMKTTRTRSLDP
jgi:hypothetical protein